MNKLQEETEDLGSASSNPFKAHIMSQNTEYYWIGKRSVENLRTSLWIMNGRGLKVFTNFLLPDEFEVSSNIYSESEPTTPTTPGYLSPRHDVGRPFTLGYHMDHEPESPTLTEARIRWRIDDLENLNKEAIYMPLDFYPICKELVLYTTYKVLTILQPFYWKGESLWVLSKMYRITLHWALFYLK